MNKYLRFSFLGILLFYFLTSLFTSCTYTQKIRDGRTAFERKQYATAIPMLRKEYKKAKRKTEQGQIAFLLGECYRRTNRPDEATGWYRTAYDYQFGMEALKQYAYMLKESGQYRQAMQAFKDLGIELGSPYEYHREINACQIALEWTETYQDSPYRVQPADFNSPAAEYGPVLWKDDGLVITSDRGVSTGEEVYGWTGRQFSDLFTVEEGILLQMPEPLNSPSNEGTAAFNADFTEVFLTRCSSPGKFEDAYCKIYRAGLEGTAWTEPEPLPFQEEGVNYGHPTLSADGQTLFFSSNHPEGWGGYDIYQTQRTPNGWSEPRLMSRSINTQEDEQFPWIDGDTLYFASAGHTGMGGLDLFSSFRFQDDWTPAFNLKPPLNSASDDFGYVIDRRRPSDGKVLQRGYLTSARPMGPGGDDVFVFEKIKVEEPPEEEVVEEVEYSMKLNVYVLEKIFAEPGNPNSRVLGRKPLDAAQLTVSYDGEEKTVAVGPDGRYEMELQDETDYRFSASKEGYLSNSNRFSAKGIARDPRNPRQVFELEVVLDKIFLEREIVLENIYYDFDKWDIREDAEPTLIELAEMLEENPGIRIQLSSHTDCRGSARYNEELSQKRAQSAVDYLIQAGISAERLVARGYGEEIPAVDCLCARCTEDEHQANRRTTFKILGEDNR